MYKAVFLLKRRLLDTERYDQDFVYALRVNSSNILGGLEDQFVPIGSVDSPVRKNAAAILALRRNFVDIFSVHASQASLFISFILGLLPAVSLERRTPGIGYMYHLLT